jgi:hypothetical protein
VGVKTEGRGLEAEHRRGKARIVNMKLAWASVAAESFLGGRQEQHRSGTGPLLVETDQRIHDLTKNRIPLVAHDKAPGLLVEATGRPRSGDEHFFQIIGMNRFVRKGARALALEDERLDTTGRGADLDLFD